jgi:hypothetical protein
MARIVIYGEILQVKNDAMDFESLSKPRRAYFKRRDIDCHESRFL